MPRTLRGEEGGVVCQHGIEWAEITDVLRSLTRPTRGRIALWATLSFLWFLLLPQDLAADPEHRHFSWIGATFWVAVLAWLLICLWLTWRGRATQRRG
jgi:hypothetical protein